MLLKRVTQALEKAVLEDDDEPTMDETVHYIEWLMVWYCRKPSAFLANVIVSRLESLRTRVADGEELDPEWSCQRLVRNWEYIAERSRGRIRP